MGGRLPLGFAHRGARAHARENTLRAFSLALEMGADAEDIGLTIHAHPTLSETLFFTAEIAEGSITDMMPPKKAG